MKRVKRHRSSPVCLKCKHKTMEYSKLLKARILGCDATKCTFTKEQKANDK